LTRGIGWRIEQVRVIWNGQRDLIGALSTYRDPGLMVYDHNVPTQLGVTAVVRRK
jgi:hypothetical protein